MTSQTSTLRRSAALLTGANLLCGVIGVAQGLLVLRMLGPNLFGAAAVLVAVGTVATNLIDVRLTDLISRLYYDPRVAHATLAGYRASVLRFGLMLAAGGALLIALVTGAATMLVVPALTSVELTSAAVLLVSAAQGFGYLASFCIFIQRFTASAMPMAAVQTVSSLINAAAMVGSVAISRSVDAYAGGLLVSAAAMAVLNGVFAVAIFRRDGVRLFGSSQMPAVERATIVRFVVAGNGLGYVKLLHRSADVLFVSAFCGDAQTGVYKIARSMADALHAFSEATARLYQPRLLGFLRAAEYGHYIAIARSMLTTAAGVTLAAVLAQLVCVPYLAPLVGVSDAHVLTATAVTLSLSFFFAAGVQIWVWPAFVFFDRPERCTLWGLIAVLTGQYLLGPALFSLAGDGSPVWFAMGYLCFYPLSLFPLWRELQHTPLVFSRRPSVAAS